MITLSRMERLPLTSRVVLSAGYDAASHTLELEFASGRIYQFDGVQPGAYEWLLRSQSKGAYVARMINDRYPYREVTPAGPGESQDLVEVLQASLRELEPPRPK
ncbi:MAG: KTSC domain-containing protein [Polyangiales bacterium]